MSKSSEAVKKWRQVTKQRMVDSFGSRCGICGYDKCNNALEFHHLNPEEKELTFGHITACPVGWNKIVIELRKCICVCSNCHKEIHDGITKVKEGVQRFNESFVEFYLEKRKDYYDECPVCGKEKRKDRRTCSKICAGALTGKADWKNVDLEKLLKTNTIDEIAEILNVSKSAVTKRLKVIRK